MRKSAKKKEVDQFELMVNQRSAFPLDKIPNPAIMTSLLLRLLQQLPRGLIDAETTKEVLASCSDGHSTTMNQMEIVESRISESKYELLHMFLAHWSKVVSTTENKMTANGMSTCVFAVVFPGALDLNLVLVIEG